MGSQILKTKASSALTKPLPPNYHALVTPVLHRRFVRASWTTVTIAYVANILMENISGWPWSAFPLGRAGINALVLFFFLMPILVLRIAQLSTTSNKSLSDVHCLLRSVSDRRLLRCVLYYTLSAWLIIQFYLWSTLPSSDLGITTESIYHGHWELNERSLYLGFYAVPLGIIQGVIHIWIDRDYLKLHDEEKSFTQAFLESAVKSIQRIGTTIIVSVISGPLSYWMLRPIVYRVGRMVVGSFTKIEPEEISQPMSDKIDLFFRSIWLTVLIVIAWESTNLSFAVEFGKGPIKEGKPISGISPDPNGSLILGLKLKKKPLSRRLAFKELSYIANEMATRRETIFKELTKPVYTLNQIITECREAIAPIATNLTPPPDAPTNAGDQKSASPVKEIKGFSPQKPIEENIMRTPAKQSAFEQWQATPGNMPKSPISLNVLKAQLVKKEVVETKFYEFLNPIFHSQYGDALRLTIQRKTTSLLPDASTQVDAINALVGFALASLKEDTYGTVQKELGGILEEFTKISAALEKYMAEPPVHWTDIHAKEVLSKNDASEKEKLYPEAVALSSAINDGLQKIGEAFEKYFDNLGLSVDARRKIRLVCEAAKKKAIAPPATPAPVPA
ncbi:uncharacterized protein DFL_009069 [Arthrobotrys flagrans]|uniref:Nucleoporin protein Ndc1-Nup n=1 Tax=Arthrobotrys flagrans TaxID=97331 RepID=A0A436ZQL7_ARTFL|nr:hypothetical protein DFL_009069 [Arthrobotrys flagrans]